jgi:hypothetical protein
MGNPFYLQEVPVTAPFCDRKRELKELQSYAEGKANVVLFSPRRYGKTSLVRRIQKALSNKGAVVLFADFFGVASVDDVASRLAKAVFVITHKKGPLWKSALRAMKSFRPVLKPDPSGGISLSVEPSGSAKSGLDLLEETMDSLREFVNTTKPLVHVALDEFQEIVTLREALQVEGIMRTQIQEQPASYFFIGSRRRILLGIFNERQRPFFQSAINYPLKLLPSDELAEFIAEQFKKSQRKCTVAMAKKLVAITGLHPYYTQKLAFFVHELSVTVTEESITRAMERLILSEKPVFEAILQGLSPHQRLLLQALAKEATPKLLASGYIQKHGLGSVGGIQHSSRQLEELDLIEKDEETGVWRPVDLILAIWLRMQMEEKLSR